MGSWEYLLQLGLFVIPSLSFPPHRFLNSRSQASSRAHSLTFSTRHTLLQPSEPPTNLDSIMAGWLGVPTLGKMSVDAAGRLWRRLKNKPKPKANEGPREQDVHTFYTDSVDTIGFSNSELDTLECLETIHAWIDTSPETCRYRHSSNWKTLS